MKWNSMKKDDAASKMASWKNGPGDVFEDSLSFEDARLRSSLINANSDVLKDIKIENLGASKETYKYDLAFGLKLYQELRLTRGMTPRTASSLGVWRHLSVNVVPDIVYARWGNNPGRYWKEARRIWLKAMWWYIYLSWQGSEEKTFAALKNNTTDEIAQLVERAGKSGYRTELYRSIMKHYGSIEKNEKSHLFNLFASKNTERNSSLFRKVMKLNTARVKVIEPSLVEGGEDRYVRDLFEYFEKK